MAQNNNVPSYLAFQFNKRYNLKKENDIVKPADLVVCFDEDVEGLGKTVLSFGIKTVEISDALCYEIDKVGKLYGDKVLVFSNKEKDTDEFKNTVNSKEFIEFVEDYLT